MSRASQPPQPTYPIYHDGAYDSVSFRFDLGILSLLCAIFPFLLGILIDDLPFVGPRWIREHLSELVIAALVTGVLGAVLGGIACRRPKTRTLGRFGLAINLIILLLFALFVFAFRWILGR